MKIDRTIPLPERIDLLNQMFENEIEHDCEGFEVNYIIVDYNKSYEAFMKLIPNNEERLEYLKTCMEDPFDAGFDISLLWGLIHDPGVEIWCNFKKHKFYIARWYHKLFQLLRSKQHAIAGYIERRLKKIYYWRIRLRNKWKEKQAIKHFMKQQS